MKQKDANNRYYYYFQSYSKSALLTYFKSSALWQKLIILSRTSKL